MTLRIAIEATIRAYAAAWKARDRGSWLNTFAAGATQEDPIGAGVRTGRQEIGEFWDRAMAAYRSVEIVPRKIVVIGHEAAMVWTLNATSAGGQRTFDGVDIFTFDDEAHITSVRAYWEASSHADAV